MNVILEFKKSKRTGLFMAFFGGGLLAAAVPILNMLFRSDTYLNTPGEPLQVLLNANWQLMAFLNILVILMGASLLYLIEFENNAIQKMKTLPNKQISMFLGKAIVLTCLFAIILLIEAGALAVSTSYWFGLYDGFWLELGKNFGFFFVTGLPTIMLALLIGSAFKNIWVSLGLNLIFFFLSQMLMSENYISTFLPFSILMQMIHDLESNQIFLYIGIALLEVIFIGLTKWLLLKIRRNFE